MKAAVHERADVLSLGAPIWAWPNPGAELVLLVVILSTATVSADYKWFGCWWCHLGGREPLAMVEFAWEEQSPHTKQTLPSD